MYILGIHVGQHDSAACLFLDHDLVAFCKEERLTRRKNCGKDFDLLAIDEVLRIGGITRKEIDIVAMTRVYLPAEAYLKRDRLLVETFRSIRGRKNRRRLYRTMDREKIFDEDKLVDYDYLRKYMKLRPDAEIRFINHHYSHILGAFKYTEWPGDALFVSVDGGGDFAYYVAYYFDGKNLNCLVGDDMKTLERHQTEGAAVGLAYCSTTELLGFTPNRHEGKVTGLAAFGKNLAGKEIRSWFRIDEDYRVESELKNRGALDERLKEVGAKLSREDMAASIQFATEELVLDWIKKMVADRKVRFIGMSGGVFSNVLLNQKVSELPGIEGTFVFPPMGDEGLPVGNCVAVLIDKLGLSKLKRERLNTVYYGYPYSATDLLTAADGSGMIVRRKADVPTATARLLEKHYVGALFAERMEMGPRALGARTILANPSERDINDSLNDRLERTEFMPFAPCVLDIDADSVFDIEKHNHLPCRYMTITVNVKDEYRDMIPAVVHIDGTARPQIIYREDNPIYYDILAAFKKLTGIPCLVNTSFNVHEEPIINTPEEALNALRHNRIDFLVCDEGIVVADEALLAEIGEE